MEDNTIQKVEWTEKCPICKKEIKFQITKDNNRNYRPYILQGCKHFAEEYIDQSKYRCVCNMLTQLFQDTDLLYARMKKKEDLEKLKMMGVDLQKYL